MGLDKKDKSDEFNSLTVRVFQRSSKSWRYNRDHRDMFTPRMVAQLCGRCTFDISTARLLYQKSIGIGVAYRHSIRACKPRIPSQALAWHAILERPTTRQKHTDQEDEVRKTKECLNVALASRMVLGFSEASETKMECFINKRLCQSHC
jgi:hypothetical protein